MRDTPPGWHSAMPPGFGEIVTADTDEFSRNRSSFYADPVAWLMAAVARQAIERCPDDLADLLRGTDDTTADRVGVVMISETCSLSTISSVQAGVARGRVSPLRFAGANPGGLTSLVCIEWRFRGPTLTLAMSPADGLAPAKIVARAWLVGGQADHVLLGVHRVVDGPDGPRHIGRCAVLGSETLDDRLGDGLDRALLEGMAGS